MLRKTKGFTLVEVAVVLVILSIVAAITIPNVSAWVKDSVERTLISETKIAVKTAQGLISRAYAAGKVPFTVISSPIITEETGLNGTSYGYEISDKGNGNKLIHLSYTNGEDHVTYCAEPKTCDEHEKNYTFVEGHAYTHELEEVIDEVVDNSTTDEEAENPTPNPDPNPDIQQPATNQHDMNGFYIDGQNGGVIFVRAFNLYKALEDNYNDQNQYGNPNSGKYNINGNYFDYPIISVSQTNDGNNITYYLVKNDPSFGWKTTHTQMLTKINNEPQKFKEIDTTTTYKEENENTTYVEGRIYYTDVHGSYKYCVFTPYTTYEPWRHTHNFWEFIYDPYE